MKKYLVFLYVTVPVLLQAPAQAETSTDLEVIKHIPEFNFFRTFKSSQFTLAVPDQFILCCGLICPEHDNGLDTLSPLFVRR